MANLKNFSGTYNVVGNQLLNTDNNTKLVLSERANVTGKKTRYFLLDKSTQSGTYISSLYEFTMNTDIDTYSFDYQSIKYILTINKAELKAYIKKQSPLYINRTL